MPDSDPGDEPVVSVNICTTETAMHHGAVQALEDYGVTVSGQVIRLTESVEPQDIWLLIIVGPSVAVFLKTLAKHAADDAYSALRGLLRRFRESWGPDGRVRLEGDDLAILLGADLSDEAYEQLADVDLEAAAGQWLVYDPDASSWQWR